MPKFRMLWVDDDWETKPENEILLKTKEELISILRDSA